MGGGGGVLVDGGESVEGDYGEGQGHGGGGSGLGGKGKSGVVILAY